MKYFGTDGVRGRVGSFPMTAEFALQFGWAVGKVLCREEGHRRVVIGKDTRISGYLFESALEAGLSAAGADCLLLGPMPTPGVAYLVSALGADAGIVISASHNPYFDNGLKLFSRAGEKLDESLLESIEEKLEEAMTSGVRMVQGQDLGKAVRIDDAISRYVEFCLSTLSQPLDLEGMRLVIDCANGATYKIAPMVFRALGAEVICLHDKPDGLNINERCGSTDPTSLVDEVKRLKAQMGMAFDGDGDRVILVDDQGSLVDGDQILYILATERRRAQTLKGGVVGTVMSNLGLEQALALENIPFERVSVGDRYVHERLKANGWTLGGEASGHILSLDHSATGCGVIAALQVCEVLQRTESVLSNLASGMTVYPQTMINIPIGAPIKPSQLEHEAIREAIVDAEAQLGEGGRIVLRPSGTEPLVRVMIEGQDAALVTKLTQHLAKVVSTHL